MYFDIFVPVNLHLFEGEGGGDGGTQGAATAPVVPGITRRGKSSGEYDNVIFGKQSAAAAETSESAPVAGEKQEAEVQTTSNTLEERRQSFKDLIKGEYKDLYDEEVQTILKRRLKDEKGLKEQVSQMQPIIDLLNQKYQVAGGDIAKLMEAIEGDDVYWQDAADEAGMTVEQYKKFQKVQRENEQLLREQRVRQGQEAANRQMQAWYQESESLKATYPDFDLAAEAQNPQFVSMLQAGVPLQHAYEVIHMDEVKAAERQRAAKSAEQMVTANVRARGSRPAENGTTSQGAFTIKDDVSKLTKKDRAEAIRRAQRGETIGW